MSEQPSELRHLEYLDFEVTVGTGNGRSYPVSVNSQLGEAQGIMQFPFDELALTHRLQALELVLLRSGGRRRGAVSIEEQTVQEFGQSLFNALLTGEVWHRYEAALERAWQEGKELRMKLQFQTPELLALPWEFLYDPFQNEYVCLANTSIVRYLDISRPVQRMAVPLPINILGVVVSPAGLPELDIQREQQRMEIALRELQQRNMMKLTWLEGQTWRDLRNTLQRGVWQILHFVGHGGFDESIDQGFITLADDNGKPSQLSARGLARLLDGHHHLKLIVLNSCEGARGSNSDIFSSTAATLVRRGMAAVLAMQYQITDRAAVEFARSFYEALAEGLPVDASVASAREAMSLALPNSIEWATPVLYMRSPDGRLFNIEGGSNAPSVLALDPKTAPYEMVDSTGVNQASVTNAQLAPTTYVYDVFISYCHVDSPWVNGYLLPRLEGAGLRVCIDYRDFEIGVPSIHNMEHAVDTSRYTLVVLTPAWIDSQWTEFESLLVGTVDPAGRHRRLLPLILQRCDLPRRIAMLTYVDFTDPEQHDRGMSRLFRTLPTQEPRELDQRKPEQATMPDRQNIRTISPLPTNSLNNLYIEAMAHFFLERWSQAIPLLQQIVAQKHDYEDAAFKLKEAQRYARLSWLYDEAINLYQAKDWASAVTGFEAVVQLDANYRDAIVKLEEARHQNSLSGLYATAQRLHRMREWQAVVKVFTQIAQIDSKYDDPEGLLQSAQHELAAMELEQRADRLYSEALHLINAGNWSQGITVLKTLQQVKSNHRDTAALLARAKQEVAARVEHERKDVEAQPHKITKAVPSIEPMGAEEQEHQHTAEQNQQAVSPAVSDLAIELTGKIITPHTAKQAQLIRTLTGHSKQVNSVMFSPNGELIVSASGGIWGAGEAPLRLWQVSDGKVCNVFVKLLSVQGVTFSPDGRLIASGGCDNQVRLWETDGGTLVHTLSGHTDWVSSVRFSPDGSIIASASDDKTVRLWQVSDGTLVRTITEHTAKVLDVAVSPDGRFIASASADTTVRLHQVSDGTLLRTFTGHTQGVRCVAFSPDGKLLASSGDDVTARVWQLNNGTLLHKLQLTGFGNFIRGIAFSPDGQLIATGSDDKMIRLWQLSNGTLLHTLLGHTGYIRSVAFSPDGQLLASGSNDQTIKIWGIR